MYRILIVLIALFVFSCSPQKRLQKTYVGRPISVVEKEFGKAKTVFEKENGKEYIFEKVEYLKSTEISQHKLTLDPMVTPQAIKTIKYFVTVVDGTITKINTEEEYERK
jgi:hypothetical protein